MNNYKFNDNTLIHSTGFNILNFISIMENGIMSFKYAKEHNVSFNRNYDGYNLDDMISCVRYLYVNKNEKDSSYVRYVMNGISFIVEDVDFIYDKNERIIHRSDEVLVKDYISNSKFKGIMMPEDYLDSSLNSLEYVRSNATSYVLVKNIINMYKDFILKNKKDADLSFYDDIDRELYAINEAYGVSKDDVEKEELKLEFKDVISDLNYEIGSDMGKIFSKILGKDNVNLSDVVSYINEKSLNLPLYVIPSYKRKVK